MSGESARGPANNGCQPAGGNGTAALLLHGRQLVLLVTSATRSIEPNCRSAQPCGSEGSTPTSLSSRHPLGATWLALGRGGPMDGPAACGVGRNAPWRPVARWSGTPVQSAELPLRVSLRQASKCLASPVRPSRVHPARPVDVPAWSHRHQAPTQPRSLLTLRQRKQVVKTSADEACFLSPSHSVMTILDQGDSDLLSTVQ